MSGAILVLDHGAELYDALVAAAPHLATDIHACHQTAKAAAELGAGRVRVLVAGPTALTTGGIRFLQRAHEEHPEVITMLVSRRANGERLAERELVRIGASDMVPFPAAPRTLRAALDRAVEMAAFVVLLRRDGEGRQPSGRIYTVTSPTGGCGKTFFATNLAYELAAHSGKRVGLIDLDLQFGEIVTALRLRPQYTISDLLAGREGGDDFLRTQLREFMVRHQSGVEVLAAPKDPAEADRITSPDITQVLQAAREMYHYVIVDTPAALTEQVLASFDLSEGLVVMATLDLPSVKNLGVFLSTLDRLKIPQEGVSLVLNKAERDVGLSPGEVQRLFSQGFKGILPYSKEVSRSYNMGRPVLEAAPGSEIARALAAAICKVLPDEPTLGTAPQAAAPPARRLSFGRLLRRRREPVLEGEKR